MSAGEFSTQFLHQFRQYCLGVSLPWTLSFHPLRFLFLLHGRLAILLHRVDLLIHWIAPLSALITASLTRSVIGDRPSHPISKCPSGWTAINLQSLDEYNRCFRCTFVVVCAL